MKNVVKDTLVLALTIGFVTALVGCDENSPYRVKKNDDKTKSALETKLTPQGTTDSGGGTGLDGKVFESYTVNPMELQAYKELVKPLMQHLKYEDEYEDDRDNKEGTITCGPDSSIEDLLKYKTWYIAPVDLSKVDKNSLGVGFIQNETDQIALQTMNAVWIDKRFFDKMTLQEQADLILHEFVMQLFFVQFIPYGELIQAMSYIYPEDGVCRDHEGNITSDDEDFTLDIKALEALYPKEQLRKLTDVDNENIRYVTNWLKENANESMTERQWRSLLVSKGFGKRLLINDGGDKDQPESIEINHTTLKRALEGAVLSGNTPDICHAVGLNQSLACEMTNIELAPKKIQVGDYELEYAEIKITYQLEDGSPLEMQFYVDKNAPMEVSKDSIIQSDSTVYNMHLFQLEYSPSASIGRPVRSGILYFEYDAPQEGLRLNSILIQNGVLVDVDKSGSDHHNCIVRRYNPTRFDEDTVLISMSKRPLNLSEIFYIEFGPILGCSTMP